jgi:hypothetical protein
MTLRIYFKEGGSFLKYIDVKSIEKIILPTSSHSPTVEITDFTKPFLHRASEFTFVGETIVTVPAMHINCIEFKQQ